MGENNKDQGIEQSCDQREDDRGKDEYHRVAIKKRYITYGFLLFFPNGELCNLLPLVTSVGEQ